MIELTRPRAFIPVHGSFVHLQRHAALARSLGVQEVLAVENGAVVELDPLGMRIVDQTQVGRVHIQHGGEITFEVLRERARMAEGGLVLVMITLALDGRLASAPEIVARGVVDDLDLSDLSLLQQAQLGVTRALNALERSADVETIELAAVRAARRVFRDALGWRPVVHAQVHRAES
jgi:ribonuclease J